MIHRQCLCCKKLFSPLNNVPDQKYCGDEQCRRARRAQWQKHKLKTDPDYRENQAKARKKWREAHPDYMCNYRKSHEDCREKERKRSAASRNLKSDAGEKMDKSHPLERVVNMDLPGTQSIEKSGYYKITPLSSNGVVNMDSYIVQLTVIERDRVLVGSS